MLLMMSMRQRTCENELLSKCAVPHCVLYKSYSLLVAECFVFILVVCSSTFAHDSRLRCGVADLYHTLYGRSRPSCLPLPEVSTQFDDLFLMCNVM